MMSTFFGIRNMCDLPVESFRTGGALWFQDLTITDPFFILPIISASTLFIMLQVQKFYFKIFFIKCFLLYRRV